MSKVINNLEITVIGSKTGGSKKAIIKYDCISDVNPDLKSPTKVITIDMATFIASAGPAIGPLAANRFWYAVLNAAEHIEGLSYSVPEFRPDWPTGSTVRATDITRESCVLHWSPPFTGYGVHSYNVYKNDILVVTLSGDVQQIEVSGLLRNSVYTFKIEAASLNDGTLYWTTTGPNCVLETAQ